MFLYKLKPSLMTGTEREYFEAIKRCLPNGYLIQPQVNLASIIERTDNTRYHNELFRNIDFCITDTDYKPIVLVEINDETHNQPDRKRRDAKVKQICTEAGIAIVTFWTRFGVKPNYIRSRIEQAISNHAYIKPQEHVEIPDEPQPANTYQNYSEPKQYDSIPAMRTDCKTKGCYIATAVYGSYDCPEVWVLRRYRDFKLDTTWYGHLLIKAYYTVSPWLVRHFGHTALFQKVGHRLLDRKVKALQRRGYSSSRYHDRQWR